MALTLNNNLLNLSCEGLHEYISYIFNVCFYHIDIISDILFNNR